MPVIPDRWPSTNTYGAVKKWLEEGMGDRYEERERASITRNLLEWSSGMPRTAMLTSDFRFSESQLNSLAAAIERLKKAEPVQHITCEAWFYGRRFQVSPHVLIPRPETEELVAKILEANTNEAALSVLDIGTGSGCIPITLQLERPGWTVHAWEVSKKALTVAEHNAKALDASVQVTKQDLFTAKADTAFDVVVSNPPYIPKSEVGLLDPNVRKYEPHLALETPDDDPQIFYKHIAKLCKGKGKKRFLAKGGQIWLEGHERFVNDTAMLFTELGEVEVLEDAQGKPRFVRVQT
jgi:release factor glutamine methyltransferase